MQSKEEWFDLPIIKKFDKDFKNKEFDEKMALGLLNETQMHWCGGCDNYKENACGCYLPDFKKEMIKKIKEHFNPKPLKFEDLKEGMWVLDRKPECEEFTFIKITRILSETDCEYLYHDKDKKVFFDNMGCHAREFEENRLFPVQYANEVTHES